MFSPFTADTAPSFPTAALVVTHQESAMSRVAFTFRPPELPQVQVVADPFVRVGPRLRSLECFSRELNP
ncbi:MAG: hypothetical protein HZA93_03055 [Verrucomicrobia bacterium]|nr:hypothetical protein [Verrucomicrobiota bacterium]